MPCAFYDPTFVLLRVLCGSGSASVVGRRVSGFQNTKRNGLPLRSCQPFWCISDVTRFSNHSHSRSSSSAWVMSFATLCLTLVHVFGTRQGQLTANPRAINALLLNLRHLRNLRRSSYAIRSAGASYALALFSFSSASRSSSSFVAPASSSSCSTLVALAIGAVMLSRAISQANATCAGLVW
jgi:hypothetical protein